MEWLLIGMLCGLAIVNGIEHARKEREIRRLRAELALLTEKEE